MLTDDFVFLNCDVVRTEKRKPIPSAIRYQVWRHYFSRWWSTSCPMDGYCYCCNLPISIENWHAGHVVAWAKGGEDTVENLRPICAQCNTSMGKMNMGLYVVKYNLRGSRGWREFGG